MLRRTHVAMVAALTAVTIAGCGGDDGGDATNAGGGAKQPAAGGGTIKIGFLSDCEGAFGSFFEPTASGANLALIKHAGAKPAGEKPTDGVTGAKIAGKDVEIVSYGCADDTADKAIEETRRMMEQEDADIIDRPALRRRGHRGRQLRQGTSGQDVRQWHRRSPGLDAEGPGAELLPLPS